MTATPHPVPSPDMLSKDCSASGIPPLNGWILTLLREAARREVYTPRFSSSRPLHLELPQGVPFSSLYPGITRRRAQPPAQSGLLYCIWKALCHSKVTPSSMTGRTPSRGPAGKGGEGVIKEVRTLAGVSVSFCSTWV